MRVLKTRPRKAKVFKMRDLNSILKAFSFGKNFVQLKNSLLINWLCKRIWCHLFDMVNVVAPQGFIAGNANVIPELDPNESKGK